MGNWIRQNLVLVAGIVLPVLLVAGFLLLQQAPRVLADPPQYDFVMVAYRYDGQHPRDYQLSFEVRDGRLQGRATPLDNPNAYPNRQHAGIFRYRASQHAYTEITYDLPEAVDDLEEPLTFTIEAASGLRLDKTLRSPDGYAFEYVGYRGRGGLMGELFGMRRRHQSYHVLSKDGAWLDLPLPASAAYYYGHDLHFMGWVVGEEGGP